MAQSTTVRRTVKPKPPQVRNVRVTRLLDAVGVGEIALTIDGVTDAYGVQVLITDDGVRGYRLDNRGNGKSYDVCLGQAYHTCTCPGQVRWAKCKHIPALLALEARGLLTVPVAISVAPVARPELVSYLARLELALMAD